MALFVADASTVELAAVRANNAPEMQLALQNALADMSAQVLIDAKMTGTGAAPNFLALLVGASAEGTVTPSVAPGGLGVATAAAIDPIELSEQIQATLIANGTGEILWKAISAGGGFGPHWMSIALYTPAQG